MLHLMKVYAVFWDKSAGIKSQCCLCLKTDPNIYIRISKLLFEIWWKNLEELVLGFHDFVAVCCLYSKLIFSMNIFGNTIRVSSALVPDQDQHYVGPDLGPNCLQRLSADNKSCLWQGKS